MLSLMDAIILPLVLLWSGLLFPSNSNAVLRNQVRMQSTQIIIEWKSYNQNSRNVIVHLPTSLVIEKAKICSNEDFCFRWHLAELKISRIDDKCDTIEFMTKTNEPLVSEFNLFGLYIYGGSEISNQTWPIEHNSLEGIAYVSSSNNTRAVLEGYWLNSQGQYLYVNEEVPLFVTQTNTTLNLTAERTTPYIRGDTTVMKYRLCTLENARLAHEHAIANVIGKPGTVPDYKMIKWPVWSTWAKYKANISESMVLDFAATISRHGFPNSQIEIDDKWEICYGSFTVDKFKFGNMQRLVRELKRRGYRVTLWIHPFVNVFCEPHFSIAKKAGYLVQSATVGNVLTTWWNGIGGYIDFTNPTAASWWTSRLKKLLNETGVDSFKFDAGESSWCPQVPKFRNMSEDHPETILKAYVKTASAFGDMIEVRVGRGTQQISPFVRMIDRDTRWNSNVGLITLIPTLLNMNILGYPFVLPDMIGGNGYNNDKLTEELFLRWLQINVFMPSLQFSYPPWMFSEKAINVTKKYIKLHASYANKIHKLMVKATVTGTPVNLPIWWIDPTDKVALSIGSEFLLGEDLLVAPVLEEGSTSRDIYLPKGKWKDENYPYSKPIQGPIWLKNYVADLYTLPYFTLILDY